MIVRRKLTSVSSLGLIFFASGKYISSSSSSSAQLHRIFHHRVHLNEQRLGAFEEEGGVEAVGGAHEEDVGLPEQVVAVAADVDQAAVGGRVAVSSSERVCRWFGTILGSEAVDETEDEGERADEPTKKE